jgi:NADH-quinone oxidoreductase subunit G
MSETTAKEAGVTDGGRISVSTGRGSITVPVVIDELPDRVVWLPTLSGESNVHETLGVSAGAVVRIGGAA